MEEVKIIHASIVNDFMVKKLELECQKVRRFYYKKLL